jgi:23S rRNA (cytidine2498-2'-O)-methyltransferase
VPVARHVFACCQVGVERWLKAEVARTHPELRPAFGRPGLVTWVSDRDVEPDVGLRAVFARVWGASLGRAANATDAIGLLGLQPGAVLHVWPREPDAEGAADEVARVKRELLETGRFGDGKPREGAVVADVIVAPGEPWVIGMHRHEATRWDVAGGLPHVEIPADAPSRAYAKIEEAIAWAHLDVRAGETAVEIGSAPGGAALALARRGVTVYGADPGEMEASVLRYHHPNGARVHHLPIKVGALRWEDLPPRVEWLLLDVHLAPQVALHAIQRFLPRLKPTLRGAVLTLKMADEGIVSEIPALVERVKRLGFTEVRATHLPSNRREICVVAR